MVKQEVRDLGRKMNSMRKGEKAGIRVYTYVTISEFELPSTKESESRKK